MPSVLPGIEECRCLEQLITFLLEVDNNTISDRIFGKLPSDCKWLRSLGVGSKSLRASWTRRLSGLATCSSDTALLSLLLLEDKSNIDSR